jgi:aminoglycoside N3'-acetyltransferase
VLQRETLIRQLRELGVRRGSPLMVHASLRRIGPIEGGADALLDALLEVLGPEGTLVMPFGSEEDEPFDPWTSPAEKEIGALAEVFRQREMTIVNDHPAARFGAQGAQSRELLVPVPLHDYYGPGSPLERFTRSGGSVLRLGADVDTVTLTHYAEYLARLDDKRRVRRHYLRRDGREEWIESLDDCDGITEWSGGDYFSQLLIDFLTTGAVRTGPVGKCTAELFDARTYVTFAVEWLETHL